jgi:hypothetical protein
VLSENAPLLPVSSSSSSQKPASLQEPKGPDQPKHKDFVLVIHGDAGLMDRARSTSAKRIGEQSECSLDPLYQWSCTVETRQAQNSEQSSAWTACNCAETYVTMEGAVDDRLLTAVLLQKTTFAAPFCLELKDVS